MASQARFEVLIPRSTFLQGGSDIATTALQHVGDTLKPQLASVDRDREVYRDGSISYYDVLTVQVDASPKSDSTIKQLGVYIADVTGVSPIYVSRQDKSGIQVWPMHFKGLDKPQSS